MILKIDWPLLEILHGYAPHLSDEAIAIEKTNKMHLFSFNFRFDNLKNLIYL